MKFQSSYPYYQLDPSINVWVKRGFEGIPYSDGDLIETRIAEIVAHATDISVLSTELRQHCTDWPLLYHLSGSRANIVRPFEEKLKGADVLEIGAGCGAITRYLGECGASVLALEGSLRRAGIARSRTRDLENVTVVADSFNEFISDAKFDVITLIGVLEYANLFTPTANPAQTMLERVRRFLRPDGLLIIAIENQFGLKYFAGAPEDHLGLPMYGIEGRYQADQPQTFGRAKLTSLIRSAGFQHASFLAPFPDYKLPVSIITEAGLAAENFDASAFAWQSARRDPQLPAHTEFSPELAWPGLFDNGLSLELANSFLVVAKIEHKEAEISEQVLAYHYSSDRLPKYCKETRFLLSLEGQISVLCNCFVDVNEPVDVSNLDEKIIFRPKKKTAYSNGHSLSREFIEIVSRDGWDLDRLEKYFRRYFYALMALCPDVDFPDFNTNSINDVSIPGRYFDLVPQNIICLADGRFEAIDLEWEADRSVTFGYLLFRSILWLVGAVTYFGQSAYACRVTRLEFVSDIFRSLGLKSDSELFDSYLEREAEIQFQVTGRSAREFFAWWPDAPLQRRITVAERDTQIAGLNHAVAERNAQIVGLNHAVAERDAQIVGLNHALAERDSHISALRSSTSWRVTRPLRFVSHQIARGKHLVRVAPVAFKVGGGVSATLRKALRLYWQEGFGGLKRGFHLVSAANGRQSTNLSVETDRNDYQKWVKRYDTIDDTKRLEISEMINGLPSKPLISVIVPVYNPKPEWLIEAIASVRNQLYPNWELCIADDASTNPAIRKVLERFAEVDGRIKVVFRNKNGHISAASNSALELASGDWIALFDHDDLLPEHALAYVAQAVCLNPAAGLIYSDEDKVSDGGLRSDPYFKCDWNPELFRSQNMVCHLGVYRRDLVIELGGFRLGFEGSQDYDLALRVSEFLEPQQIVHIPRVLYHWRVHPESTAYAASTKTYAQDSGLKALQEHLQRIGVDGVAELTPFHQYRVRYRLPERQPKVSLIIPTRNGLHLIKQCVESILGKTTYKNYEILIIDNNSDDSGILQYFGGLKSNPRVTVIRDERPFNYSALNNSAVGLAKGDFVCLVNNDIEVITPAWLEEMVGIALQPNIGAVGASLWYPNNTLQHGGVILGLGGVAGHAHKHITKNSLGYFGRAALMQSFSAVTAACLLVRKSIFQEVGGLNETDLQIAFNDIDLCLKIRDAGYRNVWTPYAELYHHESATRGLEDTPGKQARFAKEVLYMQEHWGNELLTDPAYNPNLTLVHEDFSLAWPSKM